MFENGPNNVRDTELQPCPGPFHELDAGIPKRTLSRADMERRRMEAAEGMLNGLSQSRVARQFGVSRTTASRWHLALITTGLDSLRGRKAGGRPNRLTPEQKSQIVKVFEAGSSAPGVVNNQWTAALLASLIEERFGVYYSHDHVGRLLLKLRAHTFTKQTREIGEPWQAS
jgi:transposase